MAEINRNNPMKRVGASKTTGISRVSASKTTGISRVTGNRKPVADYGGGRNVDGNSPIRITPDNNPRAIECPDSYTWDNTYGRNWEKREWNQNNCWREAGKTTINYNGGLTSVVKNAIAGIDGAYVIGKRGSNMISIVVPNSAVATLKTTLRIR